VPPIPSSSQRIGGVAVPASAAMLLGAWIDGPALWLSATLLVIAVALGSMACLASLDSRGVAVESALLPAVAAVAGIGVVHLAGVTTIALVGAGVGGVLVAVAIATERSLAREVATAGGIADVRDVPEPADAPVALDAPIVPVLPKAGVGSGGLSLAEWRVLALAVVVTFLAAIGVIGLADRGFATGLPDTAEPALQGSTQLLVVIIGASFVGSAIGYRIAATDTPEVGDATWMAVGYGLLTAIAVVVLRAVGVPVAAWPGLVTAAVYLWGVYHRLLDPVDRAARRMLDVLILTGGAVMAAAAHLRAG